jgi:hypothetical protein
MKMIFFFNACLLFLANSIPAETLFGNGATTIGTNETIIINYLSESGGQFYCDGQNLNFNSLSSIYAISGPHTIAVTNGLITFQRLTNSTIQTIILPEDATNMISVPAGKTIQFFKPIGSLIATVTPSGSTNTYTLGWDYNCPTITGPATISLTVGYAVVSFYFTDQVVQLPQQGFLNLPSPLLEVDVQKSYDLVSWTTTAAFLTDAEAGAFYRLKMLQ